MSAGYRQPRTDLTGHWLRQTPVDWALSKRNSPSGAHGLKSDHYTNRHLARNAAASYIFVQAANHV